MIRIGCGRKMKKLESRQEENLNRLIRRHPHLKSIREAIAGAYLLMEETYEKGGKLLLAGNGGSAADAEHMAGELMKRFRLPRPISKVFTEKLKKADPERGAVLAKNLESPLTAIPLTGRDALATAYLNDVGGTGMFAQQVFGLGRTGDVFLGISSSGESESVIDAAVVARAMGMRIIALTGAAGGRLAEEADIAVRAPETETYRIQELHLPIYHCWCLMLEEKFFSRAAERGAESG